MSGFIKRQKYINLRHNGCIDAALGRCCKALVGGHLWGAKRQHHARIVWSSVLMHTNYSLMKRETRSKIGMTTTQV